MPNNENAKKITKGEYELEFDKLAAFLFEQYRKQKQSIQIEEQITKGKEVEYE